MNIIVGITGGIAAYKSPLLVRGLIQRGHNVRCAATRHALQFVTIPTLETLSGQPVYHDLFDGNAKNTQHIALKDWADMLIVAPATANSIAKMAGGIADDALSTLAIAIEPQKVLLAPAMNSQMWLHPSTQRNVALLQQWGVRTVGPAVGELACGESNIGRMVEIEDVLDAIINDTEKPLKGKKWLVTAGPTYEKIDPVRFIGNYSSGKMGFALAESLAEAGANVYLISGPTALKTTNANIETTYIESAQEMYEVAMRVFGECDGAILAAAVADYRPATQSESKLKKHLNPTLSLELVPNPDILASLSSIKKPHQKLIGFALETDNESENATNKMKKKHLDAIVLNSLRTQGAGFGVDTNDVVVMYPDGTSHHIPLASKKAVAKEIVKVLG